MTTKILSLEKRILENFKQEFTHETKQGDVFLMVTGFNDIEEFFKKFFPTYRKEILDKVEKKLTKKYRAHRLKLDCPFTPRAYSVFLKILESLK